MASTYLGTHLYSPLTSLPYIPSSNGLLTVQIPQKYLQPQRIEKIKKERKIWGNSEGGGYTCDSDIIAVMIHQGVFPSNVGSDHEIQVEYMPRIRFYAPATVNGIRSRSWSSHDGCTIRIRSVNSMQLGGSIKRRRKRDAEEYAKQYELAMKMRRLDNKYLDLNGQITIKWDGANQPIIISRTD